MAEEVQVVTAVVVGILAVFLGVIALVNADAADRRVHDTQRYEACLQQRGSSAECLVVLK